MSAAAALPVFGDAYLADTQHLTLEEHGAYFKLLLIAWRSPNCALPNDDRRIATMLGCTPKKWAALRPSVMAFWTLTEYGWEQKRLSKERRYVAKKSEDNRAAAASRWSAKPRKTKQRVDANAYASPHASDHAPPPPPREGKGCSDEHQSARKAASSDVAEAHGAWNSLRAELWPTRRDVELTPQRRKKLTLRLAKHGLVGWLDMLSRIRGSPFLRGDAGSFTVTFDWVLEPRNFQKILEGNYDDERPLATVHRLDDRRGRVDRPGSSRRTVGDLVNDLRVAEMG